jgi:hypothetical protein
MRRSAGDAEDADSLLEVPDLSGVIDLGEGPEQA